MNRAYKQGGKRIVGKMAQLKNGEKGKVIHYDRITREFLISIASAKNKFNPDGIIYATREEFTI